MQHLARRTLLTAAGAAVVGSGTTLTTPALAWDVSRLGPSTLRPGSRGGYVSRLQWALNKVGGASIRIDGVYGASTTRAVRAFQRRQGLAADGIAGAATKRRLDALLDRIYPDPTGGNGPGLLQPVARIAAAPRGTTIRPGYCGTRVKLLLKRLRVPHSELLHRMTPEAVAAVRTFQRRRGLAVDGLVGPATWRALGFNAEGFRLDGWQQQPRLGLQAGPAPRIEAMIRFAREQSGADYTWGGAGPYKYGFDCSGLVLQAMHAAGVQPLPVTVHTHQHPGTRTTRTLYANPRLRRVPLRQRTRGDLVWYTDARGAIQHVAVYLGGGQVVDSMYSVKVRRDSARLHGFHRLGTVSRVFA